MSNSDSIVLLAKSSGQTSFSSLKNVKKATGTNKVGHTGTLDSFAEGLLVVCTGRLTKLCGQITAFDKIYEAVIHFGKETDTLEYTGSVVREAPLPSEDSLISAVKKWSGEILQTPPMFSAIHIDGKRASDLVREGKDFEISSRSVNVFSSEILEIKYADGYEDLRIVEFAKIRFHVSKGTYIRSLARDIANSCGSAAYLTGLFRTNVGSFDVKDSAGFSLLDKFTIQSAYNKELEYLKFKNNNNSIYGFSTTEKEDRIIQNQIADKSLSLSPDISALCGFKTIYIKNEYHDFFKNGKTLKSIYFEESLFSFPNDCSIAVFLKNDTQKDLFCGLLHKDIQGKVSYGFVLN